MNLEIRNLFDLLSYTANRVPDRIAFLDGKKSITFGELKENAERIGTCIAELLPVQSPVAVFMEKSLMEVAAFFGVLSCGDFYVPLDASLPQGRIVKILKRTQARVLLCDEANLALAEKLTEGTETSIVQVEPVLQTMPNAALISRRREQVIDADPAYVVFTSGSTGEPKGVCASHRNALDYTEQLVTALSLDENAVFGNQAPFCYDACLKDIMPTIALGARTVLIPQGLFSFPCDLISFLNEHKVNTICWVGSSLHLVSALNTFDDIKPQYLTRVVFGSEVVPASSIRTWFAACPGADFYNLYGPTETTGMCCCYHLPGPLQDGERIPIGRPLPNRQLLILSPEGKLLPPGQTGEIAIRGSAVSLGYYSDKELSSGSFIQNPTEKRFRDIIFCTGDLGYLGEDGLYYFIGRKDDQIKIMGRRIEPGEIEAEAENLPGAGLCAVIFDKTCERLVLFYTGNANAQELQRKLGASLPSYMVPRQCIHLDSLPHTPTGKIDRRALRERAEKGRL